MNQSNISGAPRKSRGRQKVSMVKMENRSNLQVTFSKRRAGLFKKASELCTLCGAEAAIVVFSPAEKAYCFGHPNAKAVLDRLSAGSAPAQAPDHNPRSQLIIEAHRNSTLRELNMELTQVESLLRAEKRRAEEIEAVRKAGRMQQWLPPSLDGLSHAQLRALRENVVRFKKNLDAEVRRGMLNHPFPPFGDVPKLTLGSREFPCYPSGALGFCHGGLFGPNSATGQATSANDRTRNDGVFFGGGGINGSSSSAEFKDIGSGGLGLNLGCDPRFG